MVGSSLLVMAVGVAAPLIQTSLATLVVSALTATRVSILADGIQVFDGTLYGGEQRTFRARSTIDVVAADAGTVRLTLNGVALGTPGPAGTVFRARYGPRGKISPA